MTAEQTPVWLHLPRSSTTFAVTLKLHGMFRDNWSPELLNKSSVASYSTWRFSRLNITQLGKLLLWQPSLNFSVSFTEATGAIISHPGSITRCSVYDPHQMAKFSPRNRPPKCWREALKFQMQQIQEPRELMDLSSHSLYRKPKKWNLYFCAALVVPLQASKQSSKQR